MTLDEQIVDQYGEGVLLADGFEGAFVGIAEIHSLPPRACYDRDKCIKILFVRWFYFYISHIALSIYVIYWLYCYNCHLYLPYYQAVTASSLNEEILNASVELF